MIDEIRECLNLVDTTDEVEIHLEASADEFVCVPQGLICHKFDGSWKYDGSIQYC